MAEGGGQGGGYPIASSPPAGAVAPYTAPQTSSNGGGSYSSSGSGYSSGGGGYGSANSGYNNNGGGGGGSNCGGADGLGGLGAGTVSSLIAGLDINLLDVKLIGLGYVRPQLVDSLCQRATNTLIVEGEKRWEVVVIHRV